ncbi:hypothetical protein CHCC20375_4213 [Bacillus licheniformis]|nr:hypothetical protein CHCC20375_4213 [Bacillus licheniformis]
MYLFYSYYSYSSTWFMVVGKQLIENFAQKDDCAYIKYEIC